MDFKWFNPYALLFVIDFLELKIVSDNNVNIVLNDGRNTISFPPIETTKISSDFILFYMNIS